MRDARATLSTQALKHNLNRVRSYAPDSRVLAMIKANAYGHGLDVALAALADADALGVATFQEALDIRATGNAQSIVLIEGVFSLEEWQQLPQMNAQCVIHQVQQVEWALKSPQPAIPIWLKINSGMNRLGLALDQVERIAHDLRAAGYRLILTSHFANADEPEHPLNATQINCFVHMKQRLDPIEASFANSAALIQWPEVHFNWVRPGLMLYGSSPFAQIPAQELGLQPVMTLSTQLIALHDLPVGVAVGYGSRHTTTRPTRLGVIGMGYGDGYPRVVTDSRVLVNGHVVPVIGRVSMDMMTVDLTDLPDAPALGDPVTLWGQGLDVDQIARAAGTLSYELFTRLSPRPRRVII